mmetsp:Transcript_36910/g.47432  ORF Transcript_36910/g.47432 Transcript_36910/m.47432 type:complete len:954 (+) Transcript_36910:60-2921(+)
MAPLLQPGWLTFVLSFSCVSGFIPTRTGIFFRENNVIPYKSCITSNFQRSAIPSQSMTTDSSSEIAQLNKDFKEICDAGEIPPLSLALNLATLWAREGQASQIERILNQSLELCTIEIYNQLLAALGREGNSERAEEVLSQMELEGVKPNQMSYSQVIKSYNKRKEWSKALEVLNRMKSQNMYPTAQTYSHAMSVCMSSREWGWALSLVEEMENNLIKLDANILTSALVACGHTNDFKSALHYETLMKRDGYALGDKHYGALISLSSKAGKQELVLQYFTEMLEMGGKPNTVLYSQAIAACNRLKKPKQALSFFLDMNRQGIEMDNMVISNVINACKEAGEWQAALGLLRRMEKFGVSPDHITYSTVIQACLRGRQNMKTVELLAEMRQKGIEPEAFTYTTVMLAMKNIKDWSKVNSVIGLFFKDCKVITARDVNFVVKLCIEMDSINSLLFVLEQAEQRGVTLSSETYRACMLMMRKKGEWKKTLALLQTMKSNNVPVAVEDYTLVLSSCEKAGWKFAMDVLNDMRKNGVEPNLITYNAAMSICAKTGEWKTALSLLNKIKNSGLKPDVISYHVAINSCINGKRDRKAIDLYGEMLQEKINPDFKVYRNLIDCCRKVKNHEKVYSIFQDALRRKVRLPGSVYSSVVISLVALERVQEAALLLEEMEDLQIKPGFVALNEAWNACKSKQLDSYTDSIASKMDALGYTPKVFEKRTPKIQKEEANSSLGTDESEQKDSDDNLDEAATEEPMSLQQFNLHAVHVELDSLDEIDDWKAAVKTMISVIKDPSVLQTQETFSKVINICSRNGEWGKALQVFSAMVPYLPDEWLQLSEESGAYEADFTLLFPGLIETACLYVLNQAIIGGQTNDKSKSETVLTFKFSDPIAKNTFTNKVFFEILSPPMQMGNDHKMDDDSSEFELKAQILENWLDTKKQRGATNVVSASVMKKAVPKLK